MLVFLPVFRLLSYIVCQQLLFCSGEIPIDKVYSWYLYRWLFLNSLWFTNNSFWLQHLVNTSFHHSHLLNFSTYYVFRQIFLVLSVVWRRFVYSFLSVTIASFIYIILFCLTYRCFVSSSKKSTPCIQSFLHTLLGDFFVYAGSYLSGTQFLILLFRAIGVRIGYDVILPHITCFTDPYLVTIGDHVCLNIDAYIQVWYDSS